MKTKISVVVLAFLVLGACEQMPTVELSNRQPIVKSNYHFINENWHEDDLRRLALQENFRSIKAKDQFELFTKLCAWTNAQWPHSVPRPWPLDNALDILKKIRAGQTGGWCGQFSYVLVDVLKSMGFFSARYVEICGANKNDSHFVVEVWSDQYQKWILLDPDYNAYFRYTESKIPVGALEIRASLFGGEPVEIVYIGEAKNGVKHRPSKFMLSLYRNVAFSLRSDLMRERRFMDNGDRLATFLFYKDAHHGLPWKNKIPYKNVSSRIDDINFDCNRVRAETRFDVEKQRLTLSLFTDGSMFNFRRFVVQGADGRWQKIDQTSTLKAKDTTTTLRVAAQNQFGRIAAPLEISIHW